MVVAVCLAVAGLAWAAWRRYHGYCRLEAFAERIGRTYQEEGGSFALVAEDGRRMELHAGKKRISIDGTNVCLTYPARRGWLGEGLVSKADVETLLLPILEPSLFAAGREIRRIVVDAGHGGSKNDGATYGGFKEKELTLEVARRLEHRLSEMGFETLMTRTNDEDVSLEARAEFANSANADLFVSIHFNASDKPEYHGFETYVANPAGLPSLRGAMGEVAPSNAFDAANARLGYLVQRRLAPISGLEDKGMGRIQFFVLRNVHCPAVLVECGYLSHPDDFRIITQPAYWDVMAEGLAAAVADFANEK